MSFCKEYKTGGGLPFYSSWAFSDNEREKAKANREALKEYEGRYCKMPNGDNKADAIAEHPGKLIYWEGAPTVNERHFHVVSNPESLSAAEIALIVDTGNLCFGFVVSGGTYATVIDIFTD